MRRLINIQVVVTVLLAGSVHANERNLTRPKSGFVDPRKDKDCEAVCTSHGETCSGKCGPPPVKEWSREPEKKKDEKKKAEKPSKLQGCVAKCDQQEVKCLKGCN
jgi:hypothetical protein